MSWRAARTLAYDAAPVLPSCDEPLADALGATLASPLLARIALPPFDTSAMDGYAVAGAGPWRVVGRIAAGGAAWPALAARTSLEVATGAAVPRGTDSVVPIEHADVVGEFVTGQSIAGRHVRRAGEEAEVGAVLASAGSLLTPLLLGLAAAAGNDTVRVVPTPTVAVLVTGDEIRLSGVPEDGCIRDAIGPMLPGLVEWLGGRAVSSMHIADSLDVLSNAVSAATADVVVVSGASSAGRRDHLREVLGGLGVELLVAGVAVRPGHPQLLARLPGDRWVVGLPGNPLAALSAVMTLLQPLLAGLAGRARPCVAYQTAAVAFAAGSASCQLVPAALSAAGASPVPNVGPAMLTGVAAADGLVVIPAGEDISAGQRVEWLALPARR